MRYYYSQVDYCYNLLAYYCGTSAFHCHSVDKLVLRALIYICAGKYSYVVSSCYGCSYHTM